MSGVTAIAAADDVRHWGRHRIRKNIACGDRASPHVVVYGSGRAEIMTGKCKLSVDSLCRVASQIG